MDKRMTCGANGSHWEGCEEVHWDCRIAQLEAELARRDEIIKRMKEKLAREHQVSDALYLLLVDDPNTKLKAEQILIDIYGKCEPSPSDVSMTRDVSTDVKTGKSVEIEELETVVEHLQIRLSEWRGVARQLSDELKEEISSNCTVIWEEVGETSPAWIAYNNLVDTEDYEANPDYYKGV